MRSKHNRKFKKKLQSFCLQKSGVLQNNCPFSFIDNEGGDDRIVLILIDFDDCRK